jgi:hypothetical protein
MGKAADQFLRSAAQSAGRSIGLMAADGIAWAARTQLQPRIAQTWRFVRAKAAQRAAIRAERMANRSRVDNAKNVTPRRRPR